MLFYEINPIRYIYLTVKIIIDNKLVVIKYLIYSFANGLFTKTDQRTSYFKCFPFSIFSLFPPSCSNVSTFMLFYGLNFVRLHAFYSKEVMVFSFFEKMYSFLKGSV